MDENRKLRTALMVVMNLNGYDRLLKAFGGAKDIDRQGLKDLIETARDLDPEWAEYLQESYAEYLE